MGVVLDYCMYSIIYEFKVKENQNQIFEKAWEELTELFYQYGNSRGSRLHRKNEQTYVAYAQWPDIDTFQKAANLMPEAANEIRQTMRNSCHDIQTLYKLETVNDLLK